LGEYPNPTIRTAAQTVAALPFPPVGNSIQNIEQTITMDNYPFGIIQFF
jgi:hypothetical protein